ncbi:MAG: flagellar basal body-associated FliL family protein [Desulfamplus sp.]|nr:flagellar basal body-associated FliL family protein [Desulfamplus sp.]
MKKKDKKPAPEPEKKIAEDGSPAKKTFFKKLLSLKFVIIFLILVVFLAGGVFAGWYFFLRKSPADIEDATKMEDNVNKDAKDQQPPPEPDFPDVVDLEQFVKIRMREGETLNYITFKISIELIKPEMRKDLESNINNIRQIAEAEAKKMSWLILRSPEGKLHFRYRLIEALNGGLPSRMIRNIYFITFIMQ